MTRKTRLSLLLLSVFFFSFILVAATVSWSDPQSSESSAQAALSPGSAPAVDGLYREFQTPPRRYSIQPYWFWNDRLDAAKLVKQMQMMADQGVYGAVVYPIDGLRTPYLSKEWFNAFGAALAKARPLGFNLNFVIDFDWPDGDARDPWLLQPIQSRVVNADPAFHMRSLAYVVKDLQGPGKVSVQAPADVRFAVAAKSEGKGRIDESTLQVIANQVSGGRLTWDAPQGKWTVMVFYLESTEGGDGGQVDLLNPKAIQTFIRIALDPYFQRLGNAFGKNIAYLVADHEGDYGYKIAWTPELFKAFQEKKGYDLRKYLPLLVLEGGRLTPKIRCDYLDVISQVYGSSFLDQLREWTESRHAKLIGHFWEAPLLFDPAVQGNFFGMERRFSMAGADTLFDGYRWPRDFVEAASVSHFQHKGMWVENQGLEGNRSYIDLGRMRTGTYMLGAWGATLLTPFFNYDNAKVLYPPDWFYDQPFWKYFKSYADAARRICFMNTGGRKVSNIAIYQPLETMWADSAPVFDKGVPYPTGGGPQVAPLTEESYSSLIWTLSSHQWNYDIMDAHHLADSRIQGKTLSLGGDHYHVLFLPAVTTIRRTTLEKIARFYDSGGMVIALGSLPRNSMEYGENDPQVTKMVKAMFGSNSARSTPASHTNAAGGRAWFFPAGNYDPKKWRHWEGSDAVPDPVPPSYIADAMKVIEKYVPKDFSVVRGSASGLFYNHMVRGGIDFYWIVNNTDHVRTNTILVSKKGEPERWQADTGERHHVFYHATPEGTEVRLRLNPGDGCYLVFKPAARAAGGCSVVSTNLDSFHVIARTPESVRLAVRSEARAGSNSAELSCEGQQFSGSIIIPPGTQPLPVPGPWRFKPLVHSLAVPYARTAVDPDGAAGVSWASPGLDDSQWKSQWVSKEVDSLRNWEVLGPFPNVNHQGFFAVLPPEKNLDLHASYQGSEGKTIRWRLYKSPTYNVNLSVPFHNRGERWGVGYAFTYIYSPDSRPVEIGVAAPNFAAWVDGKRISVQHTHAFYYQPRQAWANFAKAALHKGWNSLLIKIGNDRGGFGQSFKAWVMGVWVRDGQSPMHSPLVFSPERIISRHTNANQGFRWYRYRIPPGTTAMTLPDLGRPVQVFISGKSLKPDSQGIFHYRWPARGKPTLALRIKGEDEIFAGPRFLTGSTPMNLVSWVSTSLENYSGDASYETQFNLPAALLKHHVELDLGKVGVAAKVLINGKNAGVRVWAPFTFDITRLVHPGRNNLEIIVTNSEANKIAVGPWRANLDHIHLDGLMGPVRIVPTLDRDMVCARHGEGQ